MILATNTLELCCSPAARVTKVHSAKRRCVFCTSSVGGAAGDASESNSPGLANSSSDGNPAPPQSPAPGFLSKVRSFFTSQRVDRERLAALGMGAFAAYGVVSNATYGVCLAAAWLAFVKQTGKSPLAPGQWPGFLAFYAGLWTMQNFVRPLRFTLAVAMAPAFDNIINIIGSRLEIGKRYAFGVLLLIIAIVTSTCLFGALYLLGGFP